jgi:hypothetical protein
MLMPMADALVSIMHGAEEGRTRARRQGYGTHYNTIFLSLIDDRALIDQVTGAQGVCTRRRRHQVQSREPDDRHWLGVASVPWHRPDGKPTYGEPMFAVQPGAQLASVFKVRRISSPMTLAV